MGEELELRVATAIMETRVKWGWTFGKRAKVMAIDRLMARAAIDALPTPTPREEE